MEFVSQGWIPGQVFFFLSFLLLFCSVGNAAVTSLAASRPEWRAAFYWRLTCKPVSKAWMPAEGPLTHWEMQTEFLWQRGQEAKTPSERPEGCGGKRLWGSVWNKCGCAFTLALPLFTNTLCAQTSNPKICLNCTKMFILKAELGVTQGITAYIPYFNSVSCFLCSFQECLERCFQAKSEYSKCSRAHKMIDRSP